MIPIVDLPPETPRAMPAIVQRAAEKGEFALPLI